MYGTLSEILNVPQEQLEELEAEMKKRVKKGLVLETVQEENNRLIERAFEDLGKTPKTANEVREALFDQIEKHEKELYEHVGITPDNFDFEKVAAAARAMTTETDGFFLKKDYAKEILKQRPPHSTIKYLGYSNVEAMLDVEDVGDVFSALRFTETDEWMHETFDVAYSKFTPEDFEYRAIELRVLGDQWKEIAEKYVAKKHHNVSHLKEFGIIFLNPIAETGQGKFLRDFALLLHYFHEISYYSKLFQKFAELPNFNEKFISLLRGDVPEKTTVQPGEWLIVQRYLWKVDPEDPRLFIPRVNPESMHWRKAEEDLVKFGSESKESGLEFWEKFWSVAGLFEGKNGKELVSFDLEDVAMGAVARAEGKSNTFTYHQREALWNNLFASYVGGYEELEKMLIEHMQNGSIQV